jgi:hypothetical protein
MTANPEPMVQPQEPACHHRRTDVPGPGAPAHTASTVEWTWCRRWLACGALRWWLFCRTRAAIRPAVPVTGPDGPRRTAPAQRATTYAAVVGQGRGGRQACTAPGHAGRCPLAAALSVPAPGAADRRCEWAVEGTTDASSRERPTVRARLVGVSRRLQARETGVAEAGPEVTTGAEPPAESTAPPRVGTSVVVPAEGPGGPLGQPPPQTPSGRVGQGQKRPKTKAAGVTGRSRRAPSGRTPQAGGAAWQQAPGRPAPARRPHPVGQARRATRAPRPGHTR